jgi:hypothetical protein
MYTGLSPTHLCHFLCVPYILYDEKVHPFKENKHLGVVNPEKEL